MNKNDAALRPISFSQPFINTNRTKLIRQSNFIIIPNESDYSVMGLNLAIEDNKILKTPTTPQFPMPEAYKPFINELLNDFDDISLCENTSLEGSEDLPWTPDTPSSDSKDPLMTDAVNTTNYNSFSPTYVPLFKNQSSDQYLNSISLEFPLYTSNSSFTPIFSKHFNIEKSPMESFHESKKPYYDFPFDISSFNLPSKSPIMVINNKKRPRLHLLQFIYCLLNSTRPAQCVCWVDKDECIFKIINPNKLTCLWGRYKQNSNMSFDSLSRSLRLYYASGRLERVTGQRNQYKFVNREESIDFNRRNKKRDFKYYFEDDQVELVSKSPVNKDTNSLHNPLISK